jgi:hypothetical protein
MTLWFFCVVLLCPLYIPHVAYTTWFRLLAVAARLERSQHGFEDIRAPHCQIFGDGEGGGEAEDVFVGDVDDEALGEGGGGG